MNRREFKTEIKRIKKVLIDSEGRAYTCNTLWNSPDKMLTLYSKFIGDILNEGSSSLRIDTDGDYLCDDQVLMRRYLVLDMFEQEVLNSEALNEER